MKPPSGAFCATRILSVTFLLLCLVRPARAQTGTSVLQGVVLDSARHAPLEGALVTVTSPSLQIEQIAATDSSGFFRVPNLPTGVYVMRVDRDAYLTHERAQIKLRAGITLQVNVDLIPEAAAAQSVALVQQAPTIDLGSSSLTTTISQEMARRVPLASPSNKGGSNRSFEALASSAPEAKGDTYGTSVAGTSSPENSYLIDGLSVNNTAYGLGGTPLSSEFIEEVDVVTGGYLPEYGHTTGGVLSATTKSGSNQIRGTAWSFVTPGALEAKAHNVFEEGQTVKTNLPRISLIADVGTGVGFPIIRDKLWLYAGVQAATTRYDVSRSFHQVKLDAAGMPALDADGNTVRELIPGTYQSVPAVANTVQAIGKLSYSPTSNHSLSLTSVVAPYRSGGTNRFGIDPEKDEPEVGYSTAFNGTLGALAHQFNNDSIDNLVKWTASAAGKRVVVDTTVGWHHEMNDFLSSDGSGPGGQNLAAIPAIDWRRTAYHPITDFETVPMGYCDPAGTMNAVLCPVKTYSTGGVGYMYHALLERYQASSVLSVLGQAAGHHVMKAGIEAGLTSFDLTKAYSGTNEYRESRAGTTFSDYRNFGYLTAPDEAVILSKLRNKTSSWTVGGFLQDSWSVLDKVTINAGLRYDAQFLYNNVGTLALALPNELAPRMGFIWDPTARGHAKIFGSYARYYQHVPLDLADRALSGEPQVVGTHDAATCDPRDLAMHQGVCRTDANLTVNGGPSSPNQKYIITAGGTTPVDGALRPSSSDEIVLGGEYQLFGENRAGVSYTRRRVNDIIEDMSVNEAQTYFLGNPGRGIAISFPRPKRDYDALTFYFTRAFHKSWLAQVSYTLSWLRGNWSGLFRPETDQLDPNITADFDLQSILENRDGWLPGDRRHQIKLFGSRELAITQKHHLSFGGGVQASSGEPTNYLGSHSIYGPEEVFILPRGSGPRLPWRYSADVKLGYTFILPADRDLTISVDVFNLFDIQRATRVDNEYTSSNVLPISGGKRAADLDRLKDETNAPFNPAEKNPNFGRVAAYQPPRVVQFGLRFNY